MKQPLASGEFPQTSGAGDNYSFLYENRGGYELGVNERDDRSLVEKIMMPHDEFENIVRGSLGQGALHQSAYHGSPHRLDKFSLGAIGTGEEGNQAHGWRLYFAGDKTTSEKYRKGLGVNITLDGKPFYDGVKGRLESSTGNRMANDELLAANGNIDAPWPRRGKTLTRQCSHEIVRSFILWHGSLVFNRKRGTHAHRGPQAARYF